MHIRQGGGDALDVFLAGFLVTVEILLEQDVHHDQLGDLGRNGS